MTTRSSSRRTTVSRVVLTLLFASGLSAAACGSDDDSATDDTTDVTADDTTSTSSDDSETDDTSDDVDDSSDEGDSDGSDDTTGDSGDSNDGSDDNGSDDDGSDGGSGNGLPGEPFEGFTSDGDALAVVGVAYDDELNVRAEPGTNADVVAKAAPTADDLVATGQARSLPESIWYEVTYDGATGWVGSQFVAFMGATDDATAEFLDGGPPVEAETMVDLAQPVIEFYASEEPPSNVVQSVEASVGDLGEITYDVIGIGDDAVAGYRLHIFGMPTAGGEAFALSSIERTYLCSRGVSGEFCA